MIVSRLLGIRTESGNTILDPVIPQSLDGFSASMTYKGHSVLFRYAIKEGTFHPKAVSVNGKAVKYTFADNKYAGGSDRQISLSLPDQQDNIVR
jgi:cellobiose phosphorylase